MPGRCSRWHLKAYGRYASGGRRHLFDLVVFDADSVVFSPFECRVGTGLGRHVGRIP